MEEISIKEYLKPYSRSELVYYLPNPGNGGDSLIACATFQIFRDLKIPYRLFDLQNHDPAGKIILYGGGGNLVSYYDHAANFIKMVHQKAKKLILLPATIDHHESLLRSLGSNVDIICRERTSCEYVETVTHKPHVMLADDLVFNLNVKEILSQNSDSLLKALCSELGFMLRSSYKNKLSFPTFKELKLILGKELKLFKLRNGNTLNCIRGGLEKTDVPLPDDNIDLSSFLTHKKAINQANSFWIANQLLRFINYFTTVRTNRLHISIASALLNKEVFLYRNSYYKNEAVYRYSMEKRFPNVKFMG